MNYYSRNSPIKIKADRPPGFLLHDHSRISYNNKSASRVLKSSLNTSRTNRSWKGHKKENQQILLLEEDNASEIYIPNVNQILIQDGQQQVQLSIEEDQEEQGLSFLIDIKQESQKSSSSNNPIKIAEKQNEKQQQQLFRHFSFGDKHFKESIQNSKDAVMSQVKLPLIRQIIHLGDISEWSNSKIRKKKQYKDVKLKRGKEEQAWSTLVNNFIRKRAKSQVNDPNQQYNNFDHDNIEIVETHASSKARQVQAIQPSGFLPVNNREILSGSSRQEINNNEKQSPAKHISVSQEQVKISLSKRIQDQRSRIPQVAGRESLQLSPKRQIQSSQELKQRKREEENQQEKDEQKNEQFAYRNTRLMLEQIIKVLPAPIVPKYQSIRDQLLRKEHESKVTIRRMKQIDEMVMLLIDLHKKLIFVDDYILDQGPEEDQRILMNKEIIFGLIRRLSAIF